MKVELKRGLTVNTRKGPVKILRVLESNYFLVIDDSGNKFKISIRDICDQEDNNNPAKFIVPEEDPEKLKEAQRRLEGVKALVEAKSNEERSEVAKEYGVNVSTLYRWKKLYESTETLTALYPNKRKGGKGKSRVNSETEQVIEDLIDTYFLTNQKPKVARLIEKIKTKCYELGIKAPHESTIRRRVKWLSDEQVHKKRYGRESHSQKYEYRGDSYRVEYPLQVVQIDHTPLDIILVSSENREVLGRPHLTLAIDVYSRMVVGYYLSFDPPGTIGTGMCIANSILDKESLLEEFSINGSWPCWGVMEVIHADNAGEFKGDMLLRACEEYEIDLHWRGLSKTHWGGVVERFFKTLEERIYDLPGTTFNNTDDRENYNSEKESVMTLREFEKWMLTFIVEVYHMSNHDGIGTTPLKKWEIGIMGDENGFGMGPYPLITNRQKVLIDFLPSYKRTIQRYGVKINNIHYYSDVLRLWMSNKKQHNFKIDPRDISRIYFWNPEIEEYIEVPYRNLSYPPMSVWEYRKCVQHLKNMQSTEINEELIFEAYKTMESIKKSAIQKSKEKRKERTRSISKQRIKNTDQNEDLLSSDFELKPLKIIE